MNNYKTKKKKKKKKKTPENELNVFSTLKYLRFLCVYFCKIIVFSML